MSYESVLSFQFTRYVRRVRSRSGTSRGGGTPTTRSRRGARTSEGWGVGPGRARRTEGIVRRIKEEEPREKGSRSGRETLEKGWFGPLLVSEIKLSKHSWNKTFLP